MSQIKRYPEWAAGQFQRRKNSDAKDQKKHFFSEILPVKIPVYLEFPVWNPFIGGDYYRNAK